MFLKPPSKDTKPVSNRNQKGVFSNRNPVRIKPFKVEEEEEEESIVKVLKSQSEFTLWAKTQGGSFRSFKQEAHDFLCDGEPFQGDSLFDSKQTLKDLGAKWVQNPAKKSDCEDKTIRRGWWSAPNERVLHNLLQLPRDDRNRRQWSPGCLNETQIGMVEAWIGEWRTLTNAAAVEAVEASGTSDPAAKRMRTNEPAISAWIIDASNNWETIRRPLISDPTCSACEYTVTDQFLDCACVGVLWGQCVACTGKYRLDVPEVERAVHRDCYCVCNRPR